MIWLEFQNTATMLDTTTFFRLIGLKLADMDKIQFHIELIRYGTCCPMKTTTTTTKTTAKLDSTKLKFSSGFV